MIVTAWQQLHAHTHTGALSVNEASTNAQIKHTQRWPGRQASRQAGQLGLSASISQCLSVSYTHESRQTERERARERVSESRGDREATLVAFHSRYF